MYWGGAIGDKMFKSLGSKAYWLSCLVLFLPALARSAESVSFFVSPKGADSNPGTSLSRPWRTIQKAFKSATPGSTVFIAGGTYREALVLEVSGSQQQGYITFRPVGSQKVILEGKGVTASPWLNIVDKRYVIVEGLRFQNYAHDAGVGVGISGGSDHIEIRKNVFSHFKLAKFTTAHVIKHSIYSWNVPIRVSGDNPTRPNDKIIVDGNEISNCEEGWGETITVTSNSTNWEITNNRLHHNQKFIVAGGHYGESSDPATDQARNGIIRGNTVSDTPKQNGTGIYIDGAKDVVVERNRVMRNQIGIVVSCEHPGKAASGIVVRNNLVYDNESGGISIGGMDANTYGRVTDSKVINNTIVNNWDGIDIKHGSNIEVKNNIISAKKFAIYNIEGNSDTIHIDHNLYEPPFGVYWKGQSWSEPEEYRRKVKQDLHSRIESPQFVNAAAKDFRLKPTSPALKPGTASVFADSTERLARDKSPSPQVQIGMDGNVP